MIRVRCLGHIATSVGRREVVISEDNLGAEDLVERVRGLSKEEEPGFTKYNTLVMVSDGEAFVPASSTVVVVSGAEVVMIPVSHGG
ncbi:MAG: hypothetical protein HY247_02305 [archaeon]|nr:MAG: hypothetical protein HY247_02305 [archaeon]